MKRNGTERKYDVNGLDRCLVSFVPASFIGSSGGGIAQVVHLSAVEQVVTLTAGVTVRQKEQHEQIEIMANHGPCCKRIKNDQEHILKSIIW